MNTPSLINGGRRKRRKRSFGKNSKAGEKSAENLCPKISPEKTSSSNRKSKTSPEEKPLFSITLFVISNAKTRTKKSKITERQIPNALLKSRKKTPPFLKKGLAFFLFLFNEHFRKGVSQKFGGILRFLKSVSACADFD